MVENRAVEEEDQIFLTEDVTEENYIFLLEAVA